MFKQPSTDSLCIVVSRKEVEGQNIQLALSILQRLTETPQVALIYLEGVDIAFHGYDEDTRELFEVPEIRAYVHSLDEKFPFWLFFLNKQQLGLQCLMFCFLLPHLTEEAKAKHHPQQLQELLVARWLPALNHISEYAGLSEQQVEQLTERAIKYFTHGRLLI